VRVGQCDWRNLWQILHQGRDFLKNSDPEIRKAFLPQCNEGVAANAYGSQFNLFLVLSKSSALSIRTSVGVASLALTDLPIQFIIFPRDCDFPHTEQSQKIPPE
jgi:hypothetical protein